MTDGPAAKPSETFPFSGELARITLLYPAGPVEIVGRIGGGIGDFFFYTDGDGKKAWLNLRNVASIVLVGDDSPTAVDDAQVAGALAAFKARPGPLVDTGA
jgi:hypothetical protein